MKGTDQSSSAETINQLNRSKNSLKDQQPRKNIAITKIHTLVLKILKKHEKKEKK